MSTKARHIREIIHLPVSELTDEEIAKAAMHRLDANMAGIIYATKENHILFIFRYRNPAGRKAEAMCIEAWEKIHGPLPAITEPKSIG